MNKILLLHGALGSKKELEPLAHELTLLGFTTYSFSFSGHGESNFADAFGIDAFAKELQEFLETNSCQTANIFGYSMGGYVALYHESLFPGRIRNLITLGTKFNWNEESFEKEIKTLDPDFLTAKAPHFVEKLKTLHGDKWLDLLKRTGEMMRSLSANDHLPVAQLHKVKTKVLLGLGEKDKMVTQHETQLKHSQLQHAATYTLANTAHALETANPKELAEIIQKFLN
jgi:pimeloyl-ACP methyl ester carboxylesterase